MKKNNLLLVLLTCILQVSYTQAQSKREFYNEDFKWHISIPENFRNVESEELAEMQNKGAKAIEDTYGEKIINQSKIIFAFKNNEFNYFESNSQPFDPKIDGNYLESVEAVNEILYQTFLSQMPGIKVEKSTTVEKIDNLDFQVCKMTVKYPNNFVLNFHMYNRLFNKREFTVSVVYVDPFKGKKMLDAFKNSKFDK